jgi:ABC-type transport system substrate-binding protein
MFGYAKPIGIHYSPSDPDYVDLTGQYSYNPQRARELLAAAGYAHGFDLTMKLPPLSYAKRSGEIIASQLASIGVRVELVNLEWASWLAEARRSRTRAPEYRYPLVGSVAVAIGVEGVCQKCTGIRWCVRAVGLFRNLHRRSQRSESATS